MRRLLWMLGVVMACVAVSNFAWADAYEGISQNKDKNPAYDGGALLRNDNPHAPMFGYLGRIRTTGQGGAHASENSVIHQGPLGRTVIEAPGQMDTNK